MDILIGLILGWALFILTTGITANLVYVLPISLRIRCFDENGDVDHTLKVMIVIAMILFTFWRCHSAFRSLMCEENETVIARLIEEITSE